jgi:hypothetical protein
VRDTAFHECNGSLRAPDRANLRETVAERIPIPLPTSPLKGEEPAHEQHRRSVVYSLPFKGRVRVGMGLVVEG